MKVSELIQALQALPPDAKVTHLWDESGYTSIEHVWLANDGTLCGSSFLEHEDKEL